MKKIKGFVKGNIKLFIGIIVGGIIFGGGVYAATVAANTVSYSNTSSGITATNVQGAIDALYTKVNSLGEVYRTACLKKNMCSKGRIFSNSRNEYTLESCGYDLNDYCVVQCIALNPVTDESSCVSTCKTGTTMHAVVYSNAVKAFKSCCSDECGSSSGTCYNTCTSGY